MSFKIPIHRTSVKNRWSKCTSQLTVDAKWVLATIFQHRIPVSVHVNHDPGCHTSSLTLAILLHLSVPCSLTSKMEMILSLRERVILRNQCNNRHAGLMLLWSSPESPWHDCSISQSTTITEPKAYRIVSQTGSKQYFVIVPPGDTASSLDPSFLHPTPE